MRSTIEHLPPVADPEGEQQITVNMLIADEKQKESK